MMAESTFESILERYGEPRWDEPVPVLSEEEQQLCLEEFRLRGMRIVAATLPAVLDDEHPLTTGYVVRTNTHAIAELVNHADRIPGPHFLHDTYFPNGVAVWGLHSAIKR